MWTLVMGELIFTAGIWTEEESHNYEINMKSVSVKKSPSLVNSYKYHRSLHIESLRVSFVLCQVSFGNGGKHRSRE